MSDIDTLTINTIRTVAPDVVQKAKSGHPGAPMGLAPIAHVLFSKFIRTSPAYPKWINRDRFVLSNGHACALLYIMLHLAGHNISVDDLKTFRQWKSKCPGHPEANHGVNGIEVTTGPLGQGISNAVGLAMAEAHLAATFNRPGFTIFDNFTYVIVGDGCLQEGVHQEAASLAGHLKLGKLITIYDSNKIQIDGETNLAFTEDVAKRFESLGWHVINDVNGDSDIKGIVSSIEAAQKVTDKPSIIIANTTIGFGSKNQGLEKVHGAPLGDEDIVQIKTKLGLNPEEKFYFPKEVTDYYKTIQTKNNSAAADWEKLFAQYKDKYPELHAEIERRFSSTIPESIKDILPKYKPEDAAVASRKLSQLVLDKIAPALPEIIGGSADLTPSNYTLWKGAEEFQPESTQFGTYAGRYIRFGVREHGMAAIVNGISAYGGSIPFGATFFNFISYALGAVRLSALSKHHLLHIATHDSIGLGEDGPTHQPIETLVTLRSLPGIYTFRPADGNETSGAYWQILNIKAPHVLILSRQNLPQLAGSSIDAVSRGAYVISEAPKGGKPDAIIVATGSEVSISIESQKILESKGLNIRVVSFPAWELFWEQPLEYQKSVFLDGVPVISVEVLSTLGWEKVAHASIGIDHFGASAPAPVLYKEFGFEPEVIADKVSKVVDYYKSSPVEIKIRKSLW